MRAKYILSEVLVGLWRNVTMTVAMIVTMAVSLAMLGAGLILYMQVQDMEDFYYLNLEVSVFFDKDASPEQIAAVEQQLVADADSGLVKQYQFESQEQAYARFQEMFKEAPDLVNAAKSDSLPASFRVQPTDPEQSQAVVDKYRNLDGVANVVDQKKVLSKIFQIFGGLQNLALIIAIVQGVAALLLVANTIQVAAFSKRREVAIMKLVGASNWFVQAPFILEAVFAGVIGAILAYLTLIGAKIFLIDGTFEDLFQSAFLPIPWTNINLIGPILIGIAAVISAVTGWVTLRFQIKV